MKNMLRRNLALLLAVVMILSCAPLDGMAAVIGASQLFDQFADQLATDYSGGASIARIVQPPAAVDTYVFMVDDKPIATQKVKKGDVLYEPAAPSKDGYKFTGWRDAAGNAPVFGPVTAEATGETYTYTAQFDQVYYVFFMDDQGRVQITREGVKDDVIFTNVTIALQNPQTAITGWYADEALTQHVGETVTLANADVTLWPKVEQGHYLVFDSVGGTYFEPRFYLATEKTVNPGVPEKPGYTFTGWRDKNGNVFSFGSVLEQDVSLTAQWTASTSTSYTVIHWQENADDDGYSFKESETKTGTTDAQTSASAKDTKDTKDYQGFTAQPITQETIKGDGSTIVSVYYKRNEYSVKFYDNSNSEYTSLRITAKYGANINDKWPTYNGSNTWRTSRNGSTCQVNIDTMPLNGAKFYGPKTGSGSETAYYYVEVLPGESGTTYNRVTYKLHHSDTSPGTGYSVTDEDKYPITGFTYKEGTRNGGNYNNAKFYYTRNSYDVVFINNGVKELTVSRKYEQSLSGVAYTPSVPEGMDKNYIFAGWYDNELGQGTPYTFDGKMPAKNITVYAKWVAPKVSGVAFKVMTGDDEGQTLNVAYGETINPDDLPTPIAPKGDGWEFVTWATKDDSGNYVPFNFSTKVYADIKLYPYYVNKNQHTVAYDVNGGTGDVADDRTYAIGAEADVKAAAGLTPPAGKVFVGWKVESTDEIKQPGDKLTITGNMTLTAQWGDAPAAVTLTYYGNGGKTADGQTSTSVTHENNATISTLGSTAFTRRGYTLTGWNTQANGQGDRFDCGASVLIDSHGDNALYAVWALDAEQTVTVTYASEDAQKGTVSHTEDTIQIVSGDPVTGSTAAANPGYTFVGWYKGEARISSEAALTAATAKASLNKDADGLYADTTYIARFTKRTDLSYTVHYYWNGTATPVAESKTVDGQTYGDSITESPKPVDGCTPVSTASQTITIGAETNKIIFYYYKNVELTAKGDNVTYDGKEHTVSGFTGAPETADFSAIQVGATGTNAGTYPAAFPEDAVGTVDATRKYIVTKATDGALVIKPIADKVTVTVTEKSDTVTYDGTEHTVTGYESITADNTLYNVKASVKETPTAAWTAKGTNAGEYPVGIEAKDFKNINENFTNVEFVIVDGVLKIDPVATKVTVTVTENSGTVTYDGTEHTVTGYKSITADNTLYNVKASVKETPTAAWTATGTDAGEYPVGVKAGDFKNINKNFDNVEFVIVDGVLKIDPVKAEVIVTVKENSASHAYDGQAHSVEGYESMTANNTLYNVKASVQETPTAAWTATGTEVGTYNVGIQPGDFANTNPNFTNVRFVIEDGALKITPAEEQIVVRITGKTGSFTYDGTEKTVTGYDIAITDPNGLYTAANFAFTGSDTAKGTDVGSYQMGLKAEQFQNTNTNFDNEKVTFEVVRDGQLTISQRPVTFTGETATKVYNGEAQSITAIAQSGLVDGHTLTGLTYAATGTDAGEYPGAFKDEAKIMNGTEDVTANYAITKKEGQLTITAVTDKVIVTVTEKSGTVTYDGQAHSVHGYATMSSNNALYNVNIASNVAAQETAAWTATGTDAGEYPVGIEAKDFKNISQNFTTVEFEIVDGSLIINPITEKTITITAASEEKAYDGTALTNGGYTYTQGVLVNGDVLTATVEGSQTDAGSSANRVTGYKVMHGETDVTKNYTFAQSEDGTLTVKPVAIELTANSAEKIYDGTPLTDNGYQITKGAFVGEEGLASVTVEGSQTLVGTSANEIKAHGLKANTKAQNYAITYQPGQLTVKDRNEKYRLTVEANSGSKVYDGTALKVEGLKQLIFTVNEQTFTVSGLTAEKTATNVSESGAVAVRGTAIVKDAAGNDVTAQFDVQTVPGTLTISQRPVTITAENNTVEYTGKPHGANPAKPYTVEAAAENSGLAGGHQESNVNIAFTAINVGTYVGALEIAKNDVVILADGANVTANYKISVLPGTLEITGDKIAPNKTTPQQVESNYKLGDTIPFTITVKNVSTAIVENIIVEDPNAILVAGQGYSVSEDGHTATIPSLAPDAQVEIQAQHVVTEADILAGTVGNTATVAWENTTRTVEAGTEEIEEPNGALGVTKETTSTPKNGKTYALGETITYKITVTNTGNLTAKNIQVTDSLSAKEGQVIATIDSLAPGASQEIPFAYVVTEQDILNGKVVNEAAAKGETDDPDKKPEGGDEKEDETDDVDATLEVVKTSNKQEGQKAKLGETIEYTITVTNKGNVAYRNVKVDDELTGLHETIDELGVGASESFTTTHIVTEEDILKGHVRNVATAAADPIHNPKTGEDEIPKGSDEVTDETVAAEGALGVTKETTSTPKNGKTYALGETITYKITVTNTGNLTAKNIQVTDSLSAKEGQVIATIDSLAPGASQEIPFAYVVTEQDILNGKVVNEAAAKGETDDPDKKPEGGDEKEDETDDVDATLEVVKTSNKQEGQKAKLGETIEYTITVTNKGNVAYRNVKVDDELTGLHETIDELGVGASESFTTTYTVTEEDILKGHVRNVATAEGDKVPDPKNPDDPKKPAGEDEQDDPTDEPDASLTVVKSLTNRPNKGYFTLGETAEFDVVVTNTGNVTLKNIRLTEMLEGAEFVTGEGYTVKNGQAVIDELKPGQEDGDGQSVTVKATYTIQTKDLGMSVLKNIVAGEGEGPGKNPDDEGGTEFDVDYAKQVNAVKVWEDEENKHETRPAAITFVLMDESTGEELDRKDATAANEWSVSFDNLPAHDADGNEIIYVLKEIEVTGYDTRYGGPVEPTVAPPVIQGAPETDKGGEQIPGDAEQDEPVERDVHKIDQTIINTLRSHKLTIRYWVEVVGGQKAFDTYEKEYYYNEQYSVVSPGMYGYEPDLPRVQGRMPDEDLEIDVVYVRQIYKLTIYYIFEDGTTAHKEYEAKLYADEKFEVESPEINGYKPNLWMISGVMPDRNLNYTVIYIARTKPVEIQEAVAPLGVGSVVPNTGDCFD